jgi:hypothetical protein
MVLALVACMAFGACGDFFSPDQASPTMYFKSGKIPLGSENITLVIKNNTSTAFSYGSYFTMDYFNGKEWESFELKYLFTMEGYVIKPRTTKEMDVWLAPDLHSYKAGKYRITKSFSTYRDYQPGEEYEEGHTYCPTAEFILQ